MPLNDQPSAEPGTFPDDATEGVTSLGASASARQAANAHSLRILAILSTLMAFASISTDLYLPALPAMGAALQAMPAPSS